MFKSFHIQYGCAHEQVLFHMNFIFLWLKTMINLSNFSYSVNRAFWKITRNFHKTCQHLSKSKVVLGIETSCDDTGAAVVNTEGQILGEALNSQTKIHVE